MHFLKKNSFSYLSLLFIFIFPITLSSQVKIDEDDIPYDMSDGDISLVLLKERTSTYQEYSIARKEPPQPGMTPTIDGKGILERKFTGIGVGIDLRFALLYAFIHKNKHRLRIGDDFGLGTFLTSNQLKMRDVLLDQKIEAAYGSSLPSVDAGLTFYYGLQANYRINNTFDVGVKFLPVFATGNTRITLVGPSYGLHLRVNRFYIDYRLTSLRGKRFSNTESNGGKYLNVKYLLPEKSTFRSNGYVFASLQSYSYKVNDPYGNGNNFTPQGYENYKFGKNHFRIFKIGIGLMIH